MAKKNNRPKAKSTPKPVAIEAPIPSQVEDVAPTPPASETRAPKTPKLSRSQVAAERIEDEYAYITGDLRRVFILAAAMFALLIVLNLILGAMG